MRLIFPLLLVIFVFQWQPLQAKLNVKNGTWIGNLALHKDVQLPFRMHISAGKQPNIEIRNGTEKIRLLFLRQNLDTLVYQFPSFDSELHVLFNSKQQVSGYWHNKNKQGFYTILFTGHYCTNALFECQDTQITTSIQLGKKWRTRFAPETSDSFPAIALFNQRQTLLSGTFMTETGDYRFLDGNVFGKQLFLSCFDGSHAFLFSAELKQDTLKGKFYSGTHYETDWYAVEDENYELPNPNALTFVANTKPLIFEFNDLNRQTFHYPNPKYEDKVTIIQIMGSWCPNCKDETDYYLELYNKYHNAGLEIILIGYESGTDENQYIEKLTRFKDRHSIPFEMLVGGAANKNKAAQDFSMLNHIISFPTSIFVDRNGEIVQVHTGFNGPGTGEYYTEYKTETETFVQNLLNKK